MAYGARLWATRSFGDGGNAPANATPLVDVLVVYGTGTIGVSSIGVAAFGGPAAVTPGVIPPVVYTVTLSGSLPITGALGPKSQLALVATMTPAGVLDINLVSKRFAGTVTPVGTLTVHATGIHIAGQLTPTGVLHKLVARTITSAVTPTGALHKNVLPTRFVGGVDFVGTLEVHRQSRLPDFAASLTPAAVLRRTAIKALESSMNLHGSVSFGIQSPGGYGGRIAATGALTLTYPGGLTSLAQITMTGQLRLVVSRAFAGSMASGATVSKIASHHFTGAVGVTAVTTPRAQRITAGAGTETPSGATHLVGQKALVGTLTPTGSLSRALNVRVAGVLTSAGSRTLEGPGIGSASFVADEGTLTPRGRLTNVVVKYLAASITPTSTTVVVYYEPMVLVPGFVYSKYRRGVLLP